MLVHWHTYGRVATKAVSYLLFISCGIAAATILEELLVEGVFCVGCPPMYHSRHCTYLKSFRI